MENSNHKIDELFRQRLHDAEVPPPPFVWPAVEQGLKKRRRRWGLWIFTFGTVAAATAWFWQSNAWQGGDLLSSQGSNTNDSGLAVSAKPTQEQTANLEPTVAEPSISTVSNTQVEVAEPRVVAHSKATRAPKQASNSQPDFVAKNVPSIAAPQTSLNPVNYTFEKGNETQGVDNHQHKAAVAENLAVEYQRGAELDYLMLPTGKAGFVLSGSALKQNITPQTFKASSRRKKAKPKLCYDFTRHPSAWLVDVYAGPSLAQRSLTSRQDDEPYLKQRLATEQRGVAMNAGVRASLMFNSNFLLRTGVNFDQVTEVFEFIDPTTVIYRLEFTPGNPIPDTLGVEYGENYLKTYNRYAMLDVPFLVGMEMRRGRSGFSINAGLSANVVFHKRGAIIDPGTDEPARFGPLPGPSDYNAPGPRVALSQEVFRTNLGLSATASIQWYWHLSTHFRVFAEPSFRQVLKPITVKNHPVEQRYSILGLRLGATRIF